MLEKFDEGIWIADGPDVTAIAGFHYPTRMAAIRLSGGDLVIWSPIPLSDALRTQVDALGPVGWIVAPNLMHHLSLPEWISAYPEATVCGAPGLAAKRKDIAFDLELSVGAPSPWGAEFDMAVIGGNRILTEAVFFHDASRTTLFTDLLQQLEPGRYSGWRRWVARLDLMTEPEPTVPRKFRMAFSDRGAARSAVRRILEWPTEKVIIAHGPPVRQGGQALLHRAFAWLAP